MTEKIPFQNRIIALLLSLVLVVGLFISLFALPVELIFFNPQSYSTVLQNEEYTQIMPGILSEVLVYQASLNETAGQIDLISQKDSISAIIANHISAEMVQTTFDKVINQTFSYLNFKIPTSDMNINITDLKSELVAASPEIASEYLATLPNCTTNDLVGVDSTSVVTAADLPACKPGSTNLALFKQLWSKAFEDSFNSLPASVSLTTILPLEETLTDQNFYYYSLVRWGFRLLPIISIIILILLAVLLRKQRKVMLKWMGWLLVIVSCITLVGLVILLIGFDQFVAMLLNPYLKNLVNGFGFILLGAVQDVGYQMLIWVIVSAAIMMVFGIILLFAGRFAKEPEETSPAVLQTEPVTEIESSQTEMEKTVIPDTLEEVEQREEELKKNSDEE